MSTFQGKANIMLDPILVKIAKELTYLDSKISENGKFRREINARIGKSWSVIGKNQTYNE